MFNLHHFHYFYVVADTGSVTAASRVLHISQPALSKQLKHFEDSLNTKLFEKHGRGIRLTPIGLSLFGQARSIFEKAEYLSREFVRAPSTVSEQIRIGLGASIERSFAADVIGEFFEISSAGTTPRCSLSVSALDGNYANSYLREHVIDACISVRPLAGADVFEVASILSPVCLIAPARFASRIRNVNRRDLRDLIKALSLPWIAPGPRLRFRHEVQSILEKSKLDLQPMLESDSLMMIVRSVENGVGLALVPKHCCKAVRDPKRIIILDKIRFLPSVPLSLWVRRSDKEKDFVKWLAKAFEKLRHI